jgi:DNA polymerase elongation subunit (family B)
MKFYTNVSLRGNVVTIRGWNFGERISTKIKYEPTFFLPSQKDSEYKTVDGKNVEPIKFDSIREARDFSTKYEDVDNFKIYGSNLYQYCCLNEEYGNDYDYEKIRTVNIDIEVASEDGFPEPELANQPVTAITMSYRGRYYVLGIEAYNNTRDDVVYAYCKSEKDLLSKFLSMWRKIDPDIITGWNVEFFDIPYLVRRMNKILGEEETKKLSPLLDIRERRIRKHNKELLEYELVGLTVLDYLELYRKFTYTQQESYRLDHIGSVELGIKKLDYSEVETLHQLYKTDYQKFIDYNIRDVEIVDGLEDKMKLIEMAMAIAYDAKVNFGDVFTQVRMWDVLIHNYLLKQNIVVPPKTGNRKDAQYAGAYVKPPQIGMHDWLMSFDLNSLYPHLIMQYNISPETFSHEHYADTSVEKILDRQVDSLDNMCLTPGGYYFDKTKQGFLPEMMQRMYDERKIYKQKMIEAQNELEEVNRQLNG